MPPAHSPSGRPATRPDGKRSRQRILDAAAESGASAANFLLLRLPLEIKKLFTEWLAAHAPNRAEHILNLIRQCRDGNLNQTEWRSRMRGTGEYAGLISQRFRLACKRHRLAEARPAEFQLNTGSRHSVQ